MPLSLGWKGNLAAICEVFLPGFLSAIHTHHSSAQFLPISQYKSTYS
ncbi:MAG: hypothetical protein ACRC1Z_16600 [Waterburya sp.]